MLATTLAATHVGFDGQLISVQCDASNGLPGLSIVGLGDKAVEQARERVRGAIRNSGFSFPPRKLTINLAPADIPKDGTGYDLAIAISILVATGQLAPESVERCLFWGELGLDGLIRHTRGTLATIELADSHSLLGAYIPADDCQSIGSYNHSKIYGITTLQSLVDHLRGSSVIQPILNDETRNTVVNITTNMSSIRGQLLAKRAMEIAITGGHNIILSGPPGCGKTMLSKAASELLPPLSAPELAETTKMHSLAGMKPPEGLNRPFRTPHHSASMIALVGGGASPRPGEISLSHNGVLFLDELPEFPRYVIESLRQPLEDGIVTIARAQRSVSYPAKFMLMATQNPCPCGYLGHATKSCVCTPGAVVRYSQRLSGPLVDRFDMAISMMALSEVELDATAEEESSESIAPRIAVGRKAAEKRLGTGRTNSSMTASELDTLLCIDDAARRLAKSAVSKLALSGRGYHRLLRVSRTIADLAGSTSVRHADIAEAMLYRAI
jgi:magnesium chelatase family protein